MRMRWVLVLAGFVGGCGEGGSSDDVEMADDGGSSSTSGGTTGDDEDDGRPSNCILGQEECACLDGQCTGTLECVEDVCKSGPTIDVDDQLAVVAGPRISIEADLEASGFEWSQVSGPTVELVGTDQSTLLVDIPGDAPAGEVVTLRLEAELNTIVDARSIAIEILAPAFVDAFIDPDDEDPPAPVTVAQAAGMDFTLGSMWVGTGAGTIVRLDDDGQIEGTLDVGGAVASVYGGELFENDDRVDALYFADSAGGAARAVSAQGGGVRLMTERLDTGDPLGEIDFVLPRRNGDLVLSSATTGQLFLYALDDDVTTLLVDDLGSSPDAMVFDPDEGVLYVGTLGRVHRVPLLPDDTAGEASVYLDLGATDDPALRVDGLTFDDALNLWVGCSGTQSLYVARYDAESTTEVARVFAQVDAELSEFVSPRFGGNGFDRESLYYVNPTSGRIARLEVGLRGG